MTDLALASIGSIGFSLALMLWAIYSQLGRIATALERRKP